MAIARVAICVVVGRLSVTRLDANVNLAHYPAVTRRVYTRSYDLQ
jgi:hypothetical protein